MKKRSFMATPCLAALVLASVMLFLVEPLTPAFGADPIVIKAVTTFPKNSRFNIDVPTLFQMIEKETGGKVKINWLGGPEVIGSFEQGDALKRGTVDMIGYNPFGYFKSLMPVCLAKGLSECPAWEERKNGAFALWDKQFQKDLNAKYLGCMHSEVAFHVFSKKPLEKVDDFKGFLCRVMPLYVPFMKALGASPVTIPPADVYNALERGVTEGVMWPVFLSDYAWHEVTKYIIFPGVFQIETATVVNLDKWNKIPKDLQDTMMKCMEKVEHIATENMLADVDKEWAKLEKAGLKKITLPPAEAKKFHDIAYEETWKEVIKAAPAEAPAFQKISTACPK